MLDSNGEQKQKQIRLLFPVMQSRDHRIVHAIFRQVHFDEEERGVDRSLRIAREPDSGRAARIRAPVWPNGFETYCCVTISVRHCVCNSICAAFAVVEEGVLWVVMQFEFRC